MRIAKRQRSVALQAQGCSSVALIQSEEAKTVYKTRTVGRSQLRLRLSQAALSPERALEIGDWGSPRGG